jgi:hypothetical protein
MTTAGALKWWKDNYGHELCLLLNKTVIRDALKGLSEGQARVGNGKGKSKVTAKHRTPASHHHASRLPVHNHLTRHFYQDTCPCSW